ncbi:flavin reductase [Sporanaerobium hydrogeniformans]|uniref:Flavin reductase n=1 Tax=Sporanaerobium hydrogeniformans TaxID=3072179 RepID=A0AC61D6F0_9FIRM|nr:flavin reductase [Sporanaerobium hydrogeniformans]PHV69254.1 flavin reductase [Sporanaerobium hydrogeniformans]
MDQTALFTLTYGIFILGAENNGAKNACIINTCGQLTAEPTRVSITVLKSNLTHYMVDASKKFTVSVLGKHASLETIAHFGFQSGRNANKFQNMTYKTDRLGIPVIEKDSIATFSCKVIEQIDLGSHTLFIGEVVEATKLLDAEPMTYAYYRELKAGKVKPVNLEEQQALPEQNTQYECSVCHYIYEGDISFEQLPDTYVCPICGQPKKVFYRA